MAEFVVARPNYDLFTDIAHPWANDVSQAVQATRPGAELVDLSGQGATRMAFEQAVPGAHCFVFYGHGAENQLCAHPPPSWLARVGSVLSRPVKQVGRLLPGRRGIPGAVASGERCRKALVDGANQHLLDGKLVYAVACSSAFTLGLATARRGSGAFIGYHDTFWVHKEARLLFRRCANTAILEMLVNRRTARDAYACAVEVYDREISNFEDPMAPVNGLYDRPHILPLLKWDRFRLTPLGDDTWTIP